MVLLSHPTGNTFVREAALSLEGSGMLGEFHTSIASCGGNIFEQLSRLPGFGEIRRRSLSACLSSKLRLHPFREACRLLASRFAPGTATAHWKNRLSVDAVYRGHDRAVSRRLRGGNFRAVYCYEDGALETFRAAKARGLKCLYDLPIAHWATVRRLLAEEATRLPEWARTLDGLLDSEEKLRRKDEELRLADVVIVPSEFVRDSLPEELVAGKKIVVVPFGSPQVCAEPKSRPEDRRLKILFAGSMTQRKGLADIFEAMRLLDSRRFELHVLGTPVAGLEFYRKIFPEFVHHATRANPEVLELMQACDVFVLPSIVEGRALVQQEAMACGLPLVVTRNAGAEDLVADGSAGFLVPIRNPAAIAEKLEILGRDRALACSMGRAAMRKAAALTWSKYGRSVVDATRQAMDIP